MWKKPNRSPNKKSESDQLEGNLILRCGGLLRKTLSETIKGDFLWVWFLIEHNGVIFYCKKVLVAVGFHFSAFM
jgi:hypothetical protein